MPISILIVAFALIAIAAAVTAEASQAPADPAGGAGGNGDGTGLELAPIVAMDPPDPGAAGAGLLAALGAPDLKPLWTPPAAAAPYLEQIRAAEADYGLPENLLARLLYQESRYRPDIISGDRVSSAGAIGIAQFMPSTARDLGIDPLDPGQAIAGAAKYLRQLYDKAGSWGDALAAYNWGIGNVLKHGLAAAPSETQQYVAQISADVQL
jgi:soluble lytic murein transglycosylase-like protein